MNVEDSITKEFGELLEELHANCIDYRVTRIDSKNFAVTDDYHHWRWNLEVDEGLVTKITLG